MTPPGEDPDRVHGIRIEQILDTLEALPEDQREIRLAELCPDPGLGQEVRDLLAAATDSGDYLDELARDLLPRRPEAPETRTGCRLGPWRLLEPLGRGGMGVVHEAERADGAFEQRVAVKILSTRVAGTEAREHFLAERQILAGLTHPALTRIVDGGLSEEGLPWFAMEYVDGTPIVAHCAAQAHPREKRIALFLQVCDAVEHAHRRLIVHRDLKPDNVLVTTDGQVKLLDFGIAHLMARDANPTPRPANRTRLMTPRYASPEQARGEAVTTASDVYQLGLLLREMLTGLRPGDGPNPGADTLPGRLPLPADLAAILARALAPDPEDRYGSVDRLAQDLHRFVDRLPVSARPATWAYRGRKFLRRHALGAATAAVALVAAAGMTAFYTVRVQDERDRATVERDRARDAHARAEEQSLRARSEAAKARQMSEFLAGLFRAADPREAGAAELTARQLLDRGAARVDRELAGQPAVQADLLQVLGRTYSQLGVYDAAENLLTRALALRRNPPWGVAADTVPDENDTMVAEILGDLGTLRFRQGRYEQARRHLDDGIHLVEATRGRAAPELAPLLSSQGHVLRSLGDPARAREALERALAIRETSDGEDSLEAARMKSMLAAMLIETEELARAEELLESTLATYERELRPGHPSVGMVLMNLATAQLHLGRLAAVEDGYRRAHAILHEAYGPDHVEVGMALNNLGNYLLEKGRTDEALAVLTRALATYRAALGDDHPRLGYPLSSLADAHSAAGRFEEAARYYRRSIEVRARRQGAPEFDRVLAHGLVRLGTIDEATGDRDGAALRFGRALAIWNQAPETADPELTPALVELAGWLVDQGRCGDAAPLLQRAQRLPAGTGRAPAELDRTWRRWSVACGTETRPAAAQQGPKSPG